MAKKRKQNKKWISRILLLVLLIAAGVVAYLVWQSYFDEKKGEPQEEVVQETAEVKKDDTIKDDVPEVIEKEKVAQYDGEDPNTAEGLTGAMTYAGVSGDNLIIRVNIDQYISDGNCVLSLTRDGGEVYRDTANVATAAATATCEGFNVPVSEIGGGHYDIVIKVNSGEKSGAINGEVDV